MTTVRMLSLGLGKFGLLATNLVAQIILLVCSNRLIDIVLLSICSFHIVLLLICSFDIVFLSICLFKLVGAVLRSITNVFSRR